MSEALPARQVMVDALRGVSLMVEREEFVAIAGPSGQWEDNTLNVIAGLDLPTPPPSWIDERSA